LNNVLVPVAQEPSPRPAIQAAETWCTLLTKSAADLHLFHAGMCEQIPNVLPPSTTNLNLQEGVVDADVVEGIVTEADGHDLVVMGTYGGKGAWDALLGSTTERVLRRLNCPLLAVPVHQA